MSKASVFILDLIREGEKIRVSAYEKASVDGQTLKHYEDHQVSVDDINRLCKEIITLLNRANRRGDIIPDVISDLKKTCQSLYDELLTPKAKNALRSTLSETLVLYLDDQLVHIPWELLFNGEDFLCRKFRIGRIVSTRQSITGIQRRAKRGSLTVLIMADPQGNLDAAYKEGIKIRDEFSEKSERINVSLVSSKIDVHYVKKNLRDFDIVHYAGHADYDLNNPAQSGWLMSDGKLTAADIMKMAGSSPLPFLIFANACHSGRTGEWNIAEGIENEIYGLANAFLLSGATHYIGTFWEVLDSPSAEFATEFYKAIADDTSIGEAVWSARKRLIEIYGENNIIWASYMLYGDPSFTPFDGKAVSDEGPPLEGVSKEKQMDKKPGIKDSLRSAAAEPAKNASNIFSKIIYGIFAVLIIEVIVFSFRDKNKSTVQSSPSESQQFTANTAPLELKMNIIGQREEPDGMVSEVIIKEGGILRSKDNFQVHFSSNIDAYIYILIYDSNGEASQLFPDPKIALSNRINSGKDYSVPAEGQWFWLDENIGLQLSYPLLNSALSIM